MTREKAVQIDYHCITCGRDVDGCIRVQNDVQGYVKCLKCGLGIDKGEFGDEPDTA